MSKKCDFSGWATRNDLQCADGRVIRKDAFKYCDGETVPLVWNHQHNDAKNVLGHALLENRDEGVYAYCSFNDTKEGEHAKKMVQHGDIRSLSIFANQLKEVGSNVIHGAIREVSLVLAGANPGAFIESVMAHDADGAESGLVISYDEGVLIHSDNDQEPTKAEVKKKESKADSDKTIGDVLGTLNDEQMTAVSAIVGMALNNKKEGDSEMKHNVFDNDEKQQEATLSHSAVAEIVSDAKRYGSLKDSFLAHAEDYGIKDIEVLFPEVHNLNTQPEFINRPTDWVAKVINGTHHSPFSRVKTMFADITEDEARAKGYIKGKLKKEEVFSLLKRTTQPTTIYKKQKLDRDDTIDITDFDVVAWIKAEMRLKLDEEIARAILLGDGRLPSSDDKIDENCIKPVVNDADLFVIRWAVKGNGNTDERVKNFMSAAIKSRKNYKGSGNPTLFTTEDMLTDILLLEDTIGHKLYKTEAEVATALRVSDIVTVPYLEGYKDNDGKDVYGIIVNLKDYSVGADKGGAVSMFDDFDIDYNQMKYLMETRCSGALIKPFSAIVLRSGNDTKSEEPGLAEAKKEFAV